MGPKTAGPEQSQPRKSFRTLIRFIPGVGFGIFFGSGRGGPRNSESPPKNGETESRWWSGTADTPLLHWLDR